MTTPRTEFSRARYYRAGMRLGFQREIQYRIRTTLMILGFMVEPIIYLAVWTTVAEAQGGEIAGLTTGTLAAYYIVWTLVRVYNLGFAPDAWEWRIREGRMNDFLSQPIHPFHRDFTFFAGGKFVFTLVWIPVAAFLTLIFEPTIEWAVVNVVGFVIALWGGFAVRFVVLYLLGMINFWTTRGAAIFGIFIASELLLSGRLVPLELMPGWVADIAAWLPFKWTFQFPIDTLIGRLDPGQVVAGIGAQVLWTASIGLVFVAVWKRAIRRYGAVGN
ncbi:MAG TPA: ABC-2 family transporter protein [Acidimicrobiia bacterium]|nr:ABC-2 family transporter protein [Acidimicrobiia bacterium]